MRTIVIATGNAHKFRELKTLLRTPGIRWRSLKDYPSLPRIPETGRTFDANAMLKARAVARSTGALALADDSGLEVDALRGAPGVRSARFAGGHGDDHTNTAKLLRILKDVPWAQRQARYRCSLALADGARIIAVTRGSWRGRMALQPAGHRGFGYDPIFLIPRYSKTVGQLPKMIKQRLSHRAVAARRMRPIIRRLAKTGSV